MMSVPPSLVSSRSLSCSLPPSLFARAHLGQYFEEVLASEQAAQDSYYEECDSANSNAAGNLESNCIPEGKEQPEWYDILRSPSTNVRQSRSGSVRLLCDEPI